MQETRVQRALDDVDRESERRFRVYKEAPGFRPAPRERDASACIRRYQAFALRPCEREALTRI